MDNGRDALEFIRNETPSLAILDVMMPKMNGFDVCERIKNDTSLAETHVILLTAKGQEYDRQRGVSVGADDYLTKPFDSDRLLERAREIVNAHSDSTED